MSAPETIYLYPWYGANGGITIRALTDTGERVLESYEILANASHDAAEILTVRDAMHKDLREKHPNKRIVYAPDPKAHSTLSALLDDTCKAEQEEPEIEPVPTVSLCELCSHKTICATSTFSQGIGALISYCPEYGEQDDREQTEEEA